MLFLLQQGLSLALGLPRLHGLKGDRRSELAEVAKWKALDSRKLNQPSSEEVSGVEIRAYASPYDVPEAIRFYEYPDKCHFLIEFKYIGGEEAVTPSIEDEYIKLWLGRDSRRLCRVELDLKQYEPDVVYRVIDRLASESQSPPRQGNYQIAKEVLESYLESYFRSFNFSECKRLAKLAE